MARRSVVSLFCLFLIAVAWLIVPAVAQAQGDIELDAIVIEGRIQRPQAAYIIQRANTDFGFGAKKRSFIAKIEESVADEPL